LFSQMHDPAFPHNPFYAQQLASIWFPANWLCFAQRPPVPVTARSAATRQSRLAKLALFGAAAHSRWRHSPPQRQRPPAIGFVSHDGASPPCGQTPRIGFVSHTCPSSPGVQGAHSWSRPVPVIARSAATRQSRLAELALFCIIDSARTRGFPDVPPVGEDTRFTGHDQSPWD
jgi:hypothetical protein